MPGKWLAALVIFVLALSQQGARAQTPAVHSEQDREAIERELQTKGYAHIIVDLAARVELAAKSDEERIEIAARLIREFLGRNQRIVVAGRLLYTPTFSTQVTRETYQMLLKEDGVSGISLNVPLMSRQVSQSFGPDGQVADRAGTIGRSLSMIGANDPLSAGKGGRSQIIAIIDTGVDLNHRVFTGRIIDGHCFSTTNNDYDSFCPEGVSEATGVEASRPCDVRPACDHGTGVASIAAGYGVTPAIAGPYNDATINHLGVAPLSYIYPILVMSSPKNGDSPAALAFDLRRALQRAYQQRNSYSGSTIAAVNVSLNAPDSLYSSA